MDWRSQKLRILKGSLMINWNLWTVGGWLNPPPPPPAKNPFFCEGMDILLISYFLPLCSSWVLWLQVFDRWLLDAEWSLNAGNWMWLSYSAFFQQFFNCLCPVGFGRKLDPNGDYVRLVQIDLYDTIILKSCKLLTWYFGSLLCHQ